ncbi:hypothetical protein [Amycolatopsis nalaikhensis]|uniref:Uncharacterized protein n=1 Tax=Amycolatopsis nalaikhensis TaxID=715472 RepID=A0ABY8XQS6_9PSEU|nr:hypothetical protein [Amycolatopsis sp. 2-2]WIV57968.1 hypothetical protein QP939_04640 [Amycolatopsis sp. 2-2]
MSPTHDSDSPDGHPPEHNQSDPTIPIPLPPTPRTGRLRTLRLALRHPRPSRPSTVWPCAQDEPREGTGQIASWLLTAVVKIVTTYTQPGHRVLLLAPAPFAPAATARMSTGVHNRTAPGPYAGLLEAAWTVVRLGRGIQTQTAGPPLDTIDGGTQRPAVDPRSESESGPRPHPVGPDSDDHSGPSVASRPDPNRTPTAPGPDRFDLVLTAAEPRTLDWLQPTAWAALLTPTGTLAVITHSDRSRGRLGDPAGPLVTAAHHAGLRYHDRIALLRVPIRNSELALGATASYGPFRPPQGPAATAVRHTQVHDDLFVFTGRPATTTAAQREESSDV